MVKNPYYRQNKGRLPSDPPNYLGKVASEVWRKIVPFLELYFSLTLHTHNLYNV